MRRSLVVSLALAAALAALGSCAHRGAVRDRSRDAFGTCRGACEHYQRCKGNVDDSGVYAMCLAECRDSLGDSPIALAYYERLACEDAVAFIEGTSGRGPGD